MWYSSVIKGVHRWWALFLFFKGVMGEIQTDCPAEQNRSPVKKGKRGIAMNHVFLSGITDKDATLISREGQTPHARLLLRISHRSASGAEKHELFPVSAWRGTALQLAAQAKAGTRLSLKGYLSQRHTPEGIVLEVTAEEFTAVRSDASMYTDSRYACWKGVQAERISDDLTMKADAPQEAV